MGYLASRVYRALAFTVGRNNNRAVKTEAFNWREAIIDSFIVAGLNFFSTLSALSVLRILENPVEALLAATVAAGFGFFSSLAVKRGLRPYSEV